MFIRVEWNGALSEYISLPIVLSKEVFSVSQSIFQFTLMVCLFKLSNANVGCYVGEVFVGEYSLCR